VAVRSKAYVGSRFIAGIAGSKIPRRALMLVSCVWWALSQNCEKRIISSSCPSVYLSVRPHGTTRLPLDGFSLNLIFGYFSKICREN
jgi:hypothetical protein